jgi:hypothetical protein
MGATVRGRCTHRDRVIHKVIDTTENMELVSGYLASKQAKERKLLQIALIEEDLASLGV